MPKLIRITTAPLSMKYLLTNQMRYMREKGLDVIMISSEGKEWPDIVKNEGCDYHVISMTRKITPFADLISLWNLYRYFRKQKPDIVHTHTPKAGLLGMLAARMAGVKIRIHTIAGLRFMTSVGMQRKLLLVMEKLTGWAAAYVWPNSNSLLAYIDSNKIVSRKKMEVIGLGSSNGINLSRFSLTAINENKLSAIKSAIKYDAGLTYFLCVGRIVKDKGIDELVKAFEILYQSDNNLRMILVGSFEDELDPVTAEARQILETHPGIILTGWSDDVEYYMQFAFALVHPSYREGFPNVLLQAGAMGCPVICSAIEGNVDIVSHLETGLLFKSKDYQQLLEQMQFAIHNKSLLAKLADSLKRKVTDYYSQPVVHELIYNKYTELLKTRGFT